MKKTILLLLIIGIMVSFCGCNDSKYTFTSQGVEISVSTNSSFKLSFEDAEPNSTITVFDSESNEYKGYISVSLAEDDLSLNELSDLYWSGNCDKKNTLVNKNLMFIDTYSTNPASDELNNRHCFILKDKDSSVIAFGWFSVQDNDRNEILKLAKSIRIKKLN